MNVVPSSFWGPSHRSRHRQNITEYSTVKILHTLSLLASYRMYCMSVFPSNFSFPHVSAAIVWYSTFVAHHHKIAFDDPPGAMNASFLTRRTIRGWNHRRGLLRHEANMKLSSQATATTITAMASDGRDGNNVVGIFKYWSNPQPDVAPFSDFKLPRHLISNLTDHRLNAVSNHIVYVTTSRSFQ